MADIAGIKIGIAWQGSKTYQGDAHRSVPLREFAPLAKLPGVRLVSLQKGHGAEQLAEFRDAWPVIDFGERLDADGAFLDTAAIMAHLDLIVTSDTAVAHLAGALGVEVWMAVCTAADWRWLRGGALRVVSDDAVVPRAALGRLAGGVRAHRGGAARARRPAGGADSRRHRSG